MDNRFPQKWNSGVLAWLGDCFAEKKIKNDYQLLNGQKTIFINLDEDSISLAEQSVIN